MSKYPLKELNNENIPLRELKNGLLTYNKPHEKQEIIHITSDAKEIKEKIKSGWSLYPGISKWIVKAPEKTLCDLSDMFHNPTFNPPEVLALYRSVKQVDILRIIKKINKKSRFKDLELILLEGKSLESEIRVAGSDERICKIPQVILRFLKQTSLWKKELKRAKKSLRKRAFLIKKIRFSECSRLTRDLFKTVRENYSFITEVEKPSEIIAGVWGEIPRADVYLFVPRAGLKYLLGYVEDNKKIENIMLWEYHSGLDRCKELIILKKKIKDKRVAVVDRFYSGSTTSYLIKQSRKLEANPIGVGLFPKSKRALQKMDYILFLDKFIKCNKLSIKNNWCEELFIRVVNESV